MKTARELQLEEVLKAILEDDSKKGILLPTIRAKAKRLILNPEPVKEHIIELVKLSEIPLSNQLRKITGDPYCVQAFKNEHDDNLGAAPGSIIVHIKSGLKFLLPQK